MGWREAKTFCKKTNQNRFLIMLHSFSHTVTKNQQRVNQSEVKAEEQAEL